MTRTDALDLTFSALGDPTRRAILARLALGEASVVELAEPFDLTPRAVSKHLAVLERAGLVSRGRDAQRRPCRLEAAPLAAASAWTDQFRAFWEGSFDRLALYLEELKAAEAQAASAAPTATKAAATTPAPKAAATTKAPRARAKRTAPKTAPKSAPKGASPKTDHPETAAARPKESTRARHR